MESQTTGVYDTFAEDLFLKVSKPNYVLHNWFFSDNVKTEPKFLYGRPPKIFDLSLLTYKIGAIVVFVKRVCWCYIIKATIII